MPPDAQLLRPRADLLAALRTRPDPDVLIVGGGINGVGVMRDLAAQGVRAVLAEKGDFCSGTSAAPSRLIHGGLRYLETGEFALVRESVEERNRLLHNAPHLVKPQPVWVPLRDWTSGLLHAPLRFLRWTRTPGPKGALVTQLGLMVYDRFSRRIPALPDHRMIPPAELRETMPSLNPAVQRAAQYYDARLMHPERLTLELIMDSEAECPDVCALNYLALEGRDADGAVRLRDRVGGDTVSLRPRLVVNAAGAWVDRVNQALGIDERLVGGTRGSHLVLRHAALAAELDGRMLYFETADHRICLIYPLGDDRVLLGTTDLRSDNPDDKQCTDAEIDYLYDVLHELMPGLVLTREHIAYQYAGVRPLPWSDGGATGAISRDHQLRMTPAAPGRPYELLTLVGGKWTTYRACAEQITDAVLPKLGRRRQRRLLDEPIGGGRDWPGDEAQCARRCEALARTYGLPLGLVTRLWPRYGGGTAPVLASIAAMGAEGAAPLDGLPSYCVGEIVHLARHERVAHLCDLVLRRSLIAFDGHCSARVLDALAACAARALGWDATRQAAEREGAAALLARRHGARIAA